MAQPAPWLKAECAIGRHRRPSAQHDSSTSGLKAPMRSVTVTRERDRRARRTARSRGAIGQSRTDGDFVGALRSSSGGARHGASSVRCDRRRDDRRCELSSTRPAPVERDRASAAMAMPAQCRSCRRDRSGAIAISDAAPRPAPRLTSPAARRSARRGGRGPASSLASARATSTSCVFEARSSHQPSLGADADAVGRVDLGAVGRQAVADFLDDRELAGFVDREAQFGRGDATWASRP